MSLGDDLGSLLLGFFQQLRSLGLGQFLLAHPALRRRQAVGNSLLAVLHGLHDRRPYILHGEQHQKAERDHLPDEGGIEVHAVTSSETRWWRTKLLTWPTAARLAR